jgi:DeoR/GlpR family transcriptional regulator of sugar metabolism
VLATERQNRILEVLKQDKAVNVAVLSQELSVSQMTIRRDLLKLEHTGLLTRTFGGAVVSHDFLTLQLSFDEKETVNAQEKTRIGQEAARLIQDGETVGVSAGTTAFQLVTHISEDRHLTVATNAINIAMKLANRPNIKLLMPGGILRERSFALAGPFAEALFAEIHLNTFFLGVTGVSVEHGLTTLDLLEASLYRAMMKAAEEVIVVADHTKFGRVTLAQIAGIDKVSKIVTDDRIAPTHLQQLRDCGLEVILARMDGDEAKE